MTATKRAEIVRAAKDWLGTPYHHHARIKHGGVDCAMFPLAVYQECGVLPPDFTPPDYSMQWHLHRSEELYLKTIAPFVREKKPCECPCHAGDKSTMCVCGNGWECEGNPIHGPFAADFVVFKFGRAFSHGAIVVDWPIIIHSYIPHGVLLGDALRDGELLNREMKFFEVKHE
jgi:cell wall-associated NlpC family hydrolase